MKELKELALHAAKGTAPATFTVDTVDAALAGELRKLAGNRNQFMKNRYDIYEIIQQTADEIVPNRIASALMPFANIQQVGQNQKAIFVVKRGKARAKQFVTRVGLSGVYETFRLDKDTYELGGQAIGGAVRIDFERMLDGAESMAEVMSVMTEALAESLFGEVQKALRAAVTASGRPAANLVTENTFVADKMVKLVTIARAYSTGAAIFAPPEFVAAMGPDAIVPGATGYQGIYSPSDIEAIHSTGRISIFRGTPIVEIPQSFIDENNVATYIDPQLAYVLPTGKEKVVGVVLEGQTQMRDFENRDGSMELHLYKKMGVGIVTHHNWCIYKNTGITQTFSE